MHQGQLVFSQIVQALPIKEFSRFVAAHKAQHKVKEFSCLDQFYVMAYAQLTGRQSLRDIEANLRAERAHWFHMGLRCKTISRNTLANANKVRPWEVFADLANHLIGMARKLYACDSHNAELAATLNANIYALDSSTIDLCLSLFAWAPFRQTKAAVKVHTLLDVRSNIPSFIHITDGKVHDVKMLDLLAKQGYIEPGSFYLMDKAYVDYKRLHMLQEHKAFFVTRTKNNMQAQTIKHCKFKLDEAVTGDEHIQLTGILSKERYPSVLRKVSFTDPLTAKKLVFLTNNMTLPAATIAALYKQRWQVELFFKWIKQHLRIKSFVGTTERAVKTQIWIAIATYVLIAITKKRLNLPHSLYEILQRLDLHMFKTIPISALLGEPELTLQSVRQAVQPDLF
jgi:transposase